MSVARAPEDGGAALGRACDELAAARLLLRHDLPGPASAAAARSAVAAADEALRLLGRFPGRDAGTVTLFVRHVVRERGLAAEVGGQLRRVVNIERCARWGAEQPGADLAREAVTAAAAVLDAVSAWIEASQRVARQRSSMRGTLSRSPAASAVARPAGGTGGPGPPRRGR